MKASAGHVIATYLPPQHFYWYVFEHIPVKTTGLI